MRRPLIAAVVVALSLAAEPAITAMALSRGKPAPPLYQASWQKGTTGWLTTGGTWTAQRGVLSFGGTSQSSILAPFRLKRSSYAIVARMKLIRYRGDGVYVANSFGILFRAQRPSGHLFAAGLGSGIFETASETGVTYTAAIITEAAKPVQDESTGNYFAFQLTPGWHTYRVEVRSNDIQLYLDGQQLVEVTDNRFDSANMVGLFSSRTQFQVSSYKVVSL